MSASESYQAGRLREAIDAQVAAVRAAPADSGKRLFLFELLVFSGDLDRAQRQIDAIQFDDPEVATAAGAYRKLLDAERLRRRLFAEGLRPSFLVDPPEHVGWRLDALNRLREGREAEAAELLNRANNAVPAVSGQLNGKAVAGLRDCDDVLGTVLEVLAQGRYFWVPLEQVDTLALNAPRYPRDLLWLPARLEMEAATGEVFLPALYAGSHEHPEDAVKLGRSTDWKSSPGGPTRGVGLRTYLVDEDAVVLPEWRELIVSGAVPD